ncbi:MAG TPA: hypothetical protein VH107_00665 [Lacipirellulaceae bacterium]|nr:hypothetical protein [Lacipirellulaceae bacterium]
MSSAFAAAAILIDGAHASVPYTTPDSTYTENFDELPTDARSNNSIQTGATGSNVNYTNGWQDDTTTVSGDHISLPGWYLYHALSPGGTTGENGTNHHQRFRYGSGTGTTGSFFAFSSSTTDTDRALGFLPSTTVASDPVADPTASNDDTMFMGVRLTNNTGQTLNQFTLGFDGEQWRDAGSSTVTPVNFSWLVTPSSAAATTIHQIAGYTSVSQLGFSSPVATATGAAVIGNTDGKVTVAPFTVTGINWADGTDLWLRWGDQQQKTIMDNGMAIDNVSFLASIGTPPAGVQGDYNNNGVVDMADYVLWRNGGPLQNEVDNTGTVDAGDYAAWRTRFGNTSGSGSSLSGAAVPEPTTLVFAFLLSLPVITSRVRRDRNAV